MGFCRVFFFLLSSNGVIRDKYNIDELSMDKLKQTMTDQEWIKIYEMSQDKNLFNNLCQSLFPMIYGKINV